MDRSEKTKARDLSRRVYVYRLDADGRWSYGRNPMTDVDLARQFFRDLRREEDGKYFVVCEGERCEVRVADAPSFVDEVEIEKDAGRIVTIWITLASGVREHLDPGTLRTGRGGALYCTDSRGFTARFHRAPHLKLARHISQDPVSENYFLEVAGTRYTVRVEPRDGPGRS